MSKSKLSTWERLQAGKRLSYRQRKELGRRLESRNPGLEVVHPDAAGIDIGNESHYVAVPPGRDAEPVQEFGSWTSDLNRMAEWLKACGIKTVAMQSTGVYWITACDVLEEAGLKVFLVNARGTKNLPGRKSDVQECQWLMKLHTYGLLRNSFRPPDQIRAVRTIWRQRDRLVEDAGQSVQRMQKALTMMNVQLANAITDISGTTGMAIIRMIVNGERDPRKLAKLRDRRIRASEEEIAHSLQGHWREDVLFELRQILAGYDFQQEQIAECDEQLKKLMAELPTREEPRATPSLELPAEDERAEKRRRTKNKRRSKNQPKFDLGVELRRVAGVDLTTIDGISVMTAQTILAEVGPDLSMFPNESHFASWLGLAPNRDVSGGKVIRHYSKPMKNRVTAALRMAAQSLSHSDSYLGAKYRYRRSRMDGLVAVKATAHELARIVYRLLTKGQNWVDRGAEYYEAKRKQREMLALDRRAAAIGMRLVPENATA